jgi:hypothetical protein
VSLSERKIQFLTAQNLQSRVIMGVLVQKLGGEVVIKQSDFDEMQKINALFAMSSRPAPAITDAPPAPDELVLSVVTGDAAKALLEKQSRLVVAQ